MTMTATGYQQATDLTELMAVLAPFLRCEAGKSGGTCWPRCDGPERRALVDAVERVRGGLDHDG